MAVRFTIPRLRQGAAGAPRSSESGHLMIDTDAASHPPRRRSSAVVALAALIVVSAVARSIVAWQHSIPRLFPDEYIYTAIGRSIGHGHFAIRGGTVRFPAVFEPIVAAPIWRLFSPGLAYHLVQVENAIVASLAAIPIYLIARKLRLSDGWALAAAAYAVLVPELVLVAYISSDALGYTLAVTAVAFAVYSLDKPTTRAQVGFLIFASLAALTRVEYIVLAPAYLMVALYLDRKAILRHAIALLALLPAIGVALAGAFGYYLTDGRGGSLVTSGFLNWLVLQPYLAALVLGVAIVPGALVGLLGTRTRAEKAYALFFTTTFILILIESSKVAAATHEFKERYLFLLIALAPLSFALYVKNGLRYPKVAVAIAVVLIVTVARLADLRICRVVVQDGLSVALCHQSGRGSLVGLDCLACRRAHRHRRSSRCDRNRLSWPSRCRSCDFAHRCGRRDCGGDTDRLVDDARRASQAAERSAMGRPCRTRPGDRDRDSDRSPTRPPLRALFQRVDHPRDADRERYSDRCLSRVTRQDPPRRNLVKRRGRRPLP